jgi:hypothetical protein
MKLYLLTRNQTIASVIISFAMAAVFRNPQFPFWIDVLGNFIGMIIAAVFLEIVLQIYARFFYRKPKEAT